MRALVDRDGLVAKVIRVATKPLFAMITFTIVMLATHSPGAVDVLMRTQLGAFVLDFAWFLSGLAFWWPVCVDAPVREHFGAPMRMLYLFAGTQAHLYLAMWLLLAEFPVYGIYELAPRVTALSAHRGSAGGGRSAAHAGRNVCVGGDLGGVLPLVRGAAAGKLNVT